MDVEVPNSMAASSGASNDQEINQLPPPKQLDAGALFVLQSQGSWLHCSYHLTTSNVAPQLLSLPFALALLGWTGGVLCLTLVAIVVFYSFYLLSLVLDHNAQLGNRQLRFRDMATDILGPKWGKYCVGPLQIGACYGTVISSILLGGQSLKFIYLLYRPNGGMKLYHFISIFGGITMFLAQMPSFHSLRHINLVSVILCIAYSICATTASIHIVVVTTYFSVAISGYWAFGNKSQGTVLSNFMGSDGHILLPKWLLVMINAFAFSQVFAVTLVYLQPTNEVLENWFADPKAKQLAMRNVIPRLFFRTLTVTLATFFAALLPFFGDIMALFGAFACIPLNLILPMVFYNMTFKPSRKSVLLWIHRAIVVISSVLVAIGVVASVRQIILDAKTYNLFANI
ncbi:GABA transporter 1 [Linum perenne]